MFWFLLFLKKMTLRFGNRKERLTQQRQPLFNKIITHEGHKMTLQHCSFLFLAFTGKEIIVFILLNMG